MAPPRTPLSYLPAADLPPFAAEPKPGFALTFDGKDLSGGVAVSVALAAFGFFHARTVRPFPTFHV